MLRVQTLTSGVTASAVPSAMPIRGHLFKPRNVGAMAGYGLLQLTCLGRPAACSKRFRLRAAVFTTDAGNAKLRTAFGGAPKLAVPEI